jgi:NAD(P)-dependent dehydrogenase (short-subunit alcohol dehydrogenase family)
MKTVFIVGIENEFGRAIVESLLKRGDEVYAIGKHNPKQFMARTGFHFMFINLDDIFMLKEHAKDFVKDHKFDLVILNTSHLPEVRELDQIYLETIQESMNKDVWMKKQLIDTLDLYSKVRQVVATSSQEALICSKGWGVYSISKAALNAMIKTYASEKPWTHFSTIDPGVVMTSQLKRIFDTADPKIFPSIKRMRESLVLTPNIAAKRFLSACSSAVEYKSGSFLDMKSMDAIFDN